LARILPSGDERCWDENTPVALPSFSAA